MTDTPEKASPAPPGPASTRPDVALLAVDLGLRLGLAFYAGNGALLAYRSHHLGSTAQLRRAAARILAELPALTQVVAEGDRALFEIWARAASRRGISSRLVSAETWRQALLHPSQQRNAASAKAAADSLARRIIATSPAKNPTSLRHDAAEAIVLGLWAVQQLGWWRGPLP